MNRWIPYLFFIALFIFFTGYDLYGKTEQEMLQEHAKWVEILGLNGFSAEPVQTFKFWDSVDKKEVVHINGKGLYLTFDAKTGELIEIFNEYQSSLRCKAQDAGKRIAFSLNKESCKDKIREYYKLITGEDLPNFDFYLPPAGTVLLPTDGIGHGWKRAYKGYYFRKDYMTITLFADTGQLKRYIKRYISDLPPTVEVKISAEQARQKAIEIADKEIKDWV
ncbi:MAG TPA: hypothetical protein PKW86_08545, partial [bacterium]|nr:hypothetical protein [bacterium]